MNPIAYRVVMAPARSLAFALLGLLTLGYASSTLDWMVGPSISGVVPFVVLGALAAVSAYGAWFARDHRESESPVLHRLGLVHASFGLIAAVCIVASFSIAGAIAATAFALVAYSLLGIRPASVIRSRHDNSAVISDAHVAQLI